MILFMGIVIFMGMKDGRIIMRFLYEWEEIWMRGGDWLMGERVCGGREEREMKVVFS
jgi:hypothetical protein